MALFSKKQPTNDTFVVPLPETPAEVRRRRIISIILIVILLAILVWAIIAIYSQSKDNRSEDKLNGDSTISQPATTDNSGVDSATQNDGSGSATDSNSTDTDNTASGSNQNQTTDTSAGSGSDTGTGSATGNSSTALPATGDTLAN